MEFVLGIDGGGTSCRAALATADGAVLGRAKSGAANIRTDLTGARTTSSRRRDWPSSTPATTPIS